jgi:serine/threonine-protein kinase
VPRKTAQIVELVSGGEFATYRIESIVARGGMGVVYRARERESNRVVALKLIVPELASDVTYRARFERESRIAMRLEHPNIVPVYASGEFEGALFMAMRFIHGTDLGELLVGEHGLRVDRATALILQIASALDAAHREGLVHRDVKPGNVMVERLEDREHCYVMDFGLAKQSGTATVTRTGSWVGTLDYVAPEQILGKHVDARTDVYALGAMFFHMVAGRPPFAMGHDAAKLYAHVNVEAPPVTEIRQALPQGLNIVVGRALAKEPAQRYPSAGDFAMAVQAALAGRTLPEAEQSVATGEAAPLEQPDRRGAPTMAPRSQRDTSRAPSANVWPLRNATIADEVEPIRRAAGPKADDIDQERRRTRRPRPLLVALAVLAVAGVAVAIAVSQSSPSLSHRLQRGSGLAATHTQSTGQRQPKITVVRKQRQTTHSTPSVVPAPVRHVTKGGEGPVTQFGEVGHLSFTASTESDIAGFAGEPEATAEGTFEAPGFPPYRALGYGCSATERAGARSLTYNPTQPYCSTVYYLNSRTHVLAAFWTSSPQFHTISGTHPGMSAAEAEHIEHEEVATGCIEGITLGAGTEQNRVQILVAKHVVHALSSESQHGGVGLQFC